MIYLDIPGVGSARARYKVSGDQFTYFNQVRLVIEWRDEGTADFVEVALEGPDSVFLGNNATAASYLTNIAKAGGVDTTDWKPTGGGGGGLDTADIVRFFLDKSKTEADALATKWLTDVLWPKLATLFNKYFGDKIAPAAQTAGYANVEDYLNAQLARGRVTLSGGKVAVS